MQSKKFSLIVSTALTIFVTTLILGSVSAAATNKILYRFKGGVDGSAPDAGVTLDTEGNLYGTTSQGGATSISCPQGCGTVFELIHDSSGGWTKSLLYSFLGGADGRAPGGGVILDSAGNLYGTTRYAGYQENGTVFKLTRNSNGGWTKSVLCSFTGDDGAWPTANLIFDVAGNLYGTTPYGGTHNHGVVYELSHNSDGTWTEHVLHHFTGGSDGSNGDYHYQWGSGLIFDAAGNLYGTTPIGGAFKAGNVYKLVPNADGTWTEHVVHQFTGGTDGNGPVGTLIFDASGNLYGTTYYGGAYGCCNGNVFELTPNPNGTWKEHMLYQFTGGNDGRESFAGLAFDAAGNLYGTTAGGGPSGYDGYGVAFKLTPKSGGKWVERMLWGFMNQPSSMPLAGVVFDGAGNLYGTTHGIGNGTWGTVFEITP